MEWNDEQQKMRTALLSEGSRVIKDERQALAHGRLVALEVFPSFAPVEVYTARKNLTSGAFELHYLLWDKVRDEEIPFDTKQVIKFRRGLLGTLNPTIRRSEVKISSIEFDKLVELLNSIIIQSHTPKDWKWGTLDGIHHILIIEDQITLCWGDDVPKQWRGVNEFVTTFLAQFRQFFSL